MRKCFPKHVNSAPVLALHGAKSSCECCVLVNTSGLHTASERLMSTCTDKNREVFIHIHQHETLQTIFKGFTNNKTPRSSALKSVIL